MPYCPVMAIIDFLLIFYRKRRIMKSKSSKGRGTMDTNYLNMLQKERIKADAQLRIANELKQQQELYQNRDELLSAASISDTEYASYSYEVIMERIQEFENDLDDEHEVAIKLASFGQSVTLSVTDVGYSNPYTLVFYGYVGDQPATLIQHMTQLNFLLLAVKKADPEKPPRRIGFAVASEDSGNQ